MANGILSGGTNSNSTTSSAERIVTSSAESSPVKSARNGGIAVSGNEIADMRKQKRWPTDKAYFIGKELLMTERTYKKDLDVINVVNIFTIFFFSRKKVLQKHKIFNKRLFFASGSERNYRKKLVARLESMEIMKVIISLL